jgi:L-Ala-D/L-Glu epimerase
MKLKLIPYQLFFKYPFKIAHTKRDFTENLYLVLQDKNNFGVGEAIFPPYQPERWGSMVKLLDKYSDEINQLSKENFVVFLETLYKDNLDTPACVAAIDMALFGFFYGKKSELCSFFGVEHKLLFESSYTIGISTPNDFEKKIKELESSTAYYKLKIDEYNFEWILDLYPKITDKKFVLDANQGFLTFSKAVKCADIAASLGVQYLEQPFVKTNLEWHLQLKKLNILPIIADESFQNFNDLHIISPFFDGINIKLMKCGGLLQAIKSIKEAKKLELKTVLGCMSDSIIGIGHAQKIAHLTTWVDLDGHLLNKNNPSIDFLLYSNS